MNSLHNKIMNIQVDDEYKIYISYLSGSPSTFYEKGYIDARHAAAELANESDETISELFDALENLLKEANVFAKTIPAYGNSEAITGAQKAIAKAKGE